MGHWSEKRREQHFKTQLLLVMFQTRCSQDCTHISGHLKRVNILFHPVSQCHKLEKFVMITNVTTQHHSLIGKPGYALTLCSMSGTAETTKDTLKLYRAVREVVMKAQIRGCKFCPHKLKAPSLAVGWLATHRAPLPAAGTWSSLAKSNS